MTIYGRVRSFALSAAFAIVCLAVLLPATKPASAQTWPDRRITVIVPLGAGSASDLMARVVMDQVSKQIGQTIVVENRPGAGGTLGSNIVAKSAPDGYTILAYGALASAYALYTKLPYDTIKDFTPVIPLGRQPLVVITSPAKGYKTLADLIAAGKAKPGALNYSSAGIGSASHFGAERLLASGGFTGDGVVTRTAAQLHDDHYRVNPASAVRTGRSGSSWYDGSNAGRFSLNFNYGTASSSDQDIGFRCAIPAD